MIRRLRLPVWFSCALLGATAVRAQCTPLATALNVLPGVRGSVRTMVPWDPDGSGPLGPGLVVGGSFTAAGATAATGVAYVDLATGTFARLGDPGGSVSCLATDAQQQLYAVSGQRVCRWNGVQWLPLSLQIDGDVQRLLVLPNGDLVIGGGFNFVDGVLCPGLARRQASGWSALGFDVGTSVTDLERLANGDLLVAGDLVTPGGSGRLATVANGVVGFLPGAPAGAFQVAIAPGGDLVVASLQPTPGVYRRSGGLWTSLTPQGSVGTALHVAQNGDVYCGGNFLTFEGTACTHIARFDGAAWGPVGSGVGDAFQPTVQSLIDAPGGGVYAGGNFLRAGDVAAASVARWDGAAWRPFGGGIAAQVSAVLALPDGDTIVAGEFDGLVDANGARCHRIARRSNGQWFAMGQGVDGRVQVLLRLQNGDLVAGGFFQNAGGVPCRTIARWDGTAWHALGTGTDGGVASLAQLPNGDLLVGGTFASAGGVTVGNCARWDGSAWHTAGFFDAGVNSLVVRPDGLVLAGGFFATVDGLPVQHVAVGNGTTWAGLGAGVPGLVSRVALSPSLGTFATAGLNLLRFDGSQWGPVASAPSLVYAVTVLPDDSLLLAAAAPGGLPNASSLVRYDGSALTNWATLQNGSVLALAVDRDGQIVCGGDFERSGGITSPNLLQFVSSCPAAQVPFGAGCTSGAGVARLEAVSSPWLGGTWRAHGSALPAGAPFAVQVLGEPDFPLPLSWLLPEGQPGCNLYVLPILLDVTPVTAGASDVAWRVPALPALAGRSLAIQQLPFEFGPVGVSGVFATNALRATVGAY